MGLKDLVKQAKKTVLVDGNGNKIEKDTSKVPFIGIDFNLPNEPLEQTKLKNTLETILSTIKDNEKNNLTELTDQQKKAFILTFYRLALSQDARAVGCFHPSEISTELNLCHRKMYLQKGRVQKDKSFVPFTANNRMQRLVDLGTLAHLYVQENLDRAKVLIDMESIVDDPRVGISGKADGEVSFYGNDDLGVFYDEDMILEVKTINSYGFKMLKRPKPEHVKQASIYGSVLKKYDKICFIYYNKDTSDLKIMVQQIDHNYYQWFEEVAEEIVRMFNVNSRNSRSTDVFKHTNIPKGVCLNNATNRAMECPYRESCFSLKN